MKDTGLLSSRFFLTYAYFEVLLLVTLTLILTLTLTLTLTNKIYYDDFSELATQNFDCHITLST